MKKAWKTPILHAHGSVNEITKQVTTATCPSPDKQVSTDDGFVMGGTSIGCIS